MLKILGTVVAMTGAAMTSQFPEFTQQYMQRLGGQVSALEVVIRDFDASAAKADMTREQALASMGGSIFLENRRQDMRRTIDRHAQLTIDLEQLQNATPLERLSLPHRVTDRDTAQETWHEFKPAVPLTTAGAVAALAGFVLVSILLKTLFWLLMAPFRRKKQASGLQF